MCMEVVKEKQICKEILVKETRKLLTYRQTKKFCTKYPFYYEFSTG